MQRSVGKFSQAAPYYYGSTGIVSKDYIWKVYRWMTVGLMATAGSAVITGNSPAMLEFFMSSQLLFFGLLIGQIILLGSLVTFIEKMSVGAALGAFLFFTLLEGVILSPIFMVYTRASIANTFLVSGSTFGLMSLYGATTKKDLTSWGSILFMGLIGIFLASIVNIFLGSGMMDMIISVAGVLIFTGLTAYDTQKLKEMSTQYEAGSVAEFKGSILGAITLFLDFINLFMFFLRFLGVRREE